MSKARKDGGPWVPRTASVAAARPYFTLLGKHPSRSSRLTRAAKAPKPVGRVASQNHPLKRGLLVAIEGIDGAGKTTQINLLRDRFTARGYDVVTSKEPTSGPWGQLIRDSAKRGRLAPAEELAAFLADRQEHVQNVIRPGIDRGALVILDRYYFSTIAYQGLHGVDPESIRLANEVFAPVPDLLAVLDLDPEVSLRRIETRGDEANHFERAHLLELSRAIFRRYTYTGPRPSHDGRPCWAVLIDAQRPTQEVTQILENTILHIAVEALAADPEWVSAEHKLSATSAIFGHPA